MTLYRLIYTLNEGTYQMDIKMDNLLKALRKNNEKEVVTIVSSIIEEPKTNVIDFKTRNDGSIVGLNLFQVINAMIKTHGLVLTKELLKDYVSDIEQLETK